MGASSPELQKLFDRDGGKPTYVRNMFGRIARVYDLMNGVMTGGLDRRWRKFTAQQLALKGAARVLDIGTGTADLALTVVKENGAETHVTGIDFTEEMLQVGRIKLQKMGLQNNVELLIGDGENLQFADESFNGVCSAFVMRNLTHLDRGIREQFRVLQPGARMVCLEITHPPSPILAGLFHLYFDRLIPVVGKLVGKSFESYNYLHQSLAVFPNAPKLKQMMESAGFVNVRYYYRTFGVVAVHVGEKPQTKTE